MSDPFIAEIIMFGGNFAPRGWALCDGQLLSISQNTALFSLLGTTYGGDGRTTFGLPDLRGRVAMHPGSGPGLSTRRLGEKSGVETVTLNINQIPSHQHNTTVTGTGTAQGTDTQGDNGFTGGNTWAHVGANLYKDATPDVAMKAGNVALDLTVTNPNAGSGQNHTNLQPYLCVNFIIALQGVFPSRN